MVSGDDRLKIRVVGGRYSILWRKRWKFQYLSSLAVNTREALQVFAGFQSFQMILDLREVASN